MDCLFEAGTSVEVVDDREYGYWADGQGISSVGCFGKASNWCVVAGGGPGCICGFDSVVKVGEVVEPLVRESFEFNKAPSVSSGT